MNIGINLRMLMPNKIGGMEGYVRCLVKEFIRQYNQHRYHLFLGKAAYQTFSSDNGQLTIERLNDREPILAMKKALSKFEFWFCPLLILEPYEVALPNAITVPDVQHEIYPEFFSQEELAWRIQNYRASMQRANLIFTLSHYSKDTIVEYCEVPEEKVIVTYLDAHEIFTQPLDEELRKCIQKKYNLPKRYAYYPANSWPHKNHVNLIKALKILHDDYHESINLIFTGSRQMRYNHIQKYIHELKMDHRVRHLGYVDKNHLPYIYADAVFLVFPSQFEGFGIPLVEAMRVGCPITCSHVTSIPEVAGPAALYFNPNAPEEMADSMAQLIRNPGFRKALVVKGYNQVNKFSWSKVAEITINKVTELCNS
ncbi:MAG: glycosyltransferase family 4 protein [bacterium]